MAEQNIILSPSESKVVSFEATPTVAKTYQVSVDGLSGSFTAIAAPAVKVTAITLDKAEIAPAEPFVISIAFSNPSDHDVWVKPKFAFGKITDTTFTAEKVLAGESWDPETGIYIDPAGATEWADLGHPNHPGSNMPQFVYDPDGIPVLLAGGLCWLKIPARGQATTSRLWYITRKAFTYGIRDVCVKVDDIFYLVHDPGCSTRTVGGQTVVVNYRPVALDPFTGVVNNIAAIGLSPTAVTIDALEIGPTSVKITLTNHTGGTYVDEPNRPHGNKRTVLWVNGYAGEAFTFKGREYEKGQFLAFLAYTTQTRGVGDIPPWTRVITMSLRESIPLGKLGYAWVHFAAINDAPTPQVIYVESDAGFKGTFGSPNWEWIPFRIDYSGWGGYVQTFVEL